MNNTATIRVLHVLHRLDFGGIESWLLDLVRWSAGGQLQHHFLVHSQPGIREAEFTILGGTIIRGENPHHYVKFSRKLRDVLQHDKPYQVVHSHLHLYSGIVMRIAHQEQVPIRIAHGHSITPDGTQLWRRLYKSLMQRWIHSHANVGLAASHPALIHLFGTKSDPRWEVLHCGIDLARFSVRHDNEKIREELGVSKSARLIGHVGRLVDEKNHTFMLKIAAAYPEAWFLFVGDGPLRAQLESLAKSLHVDDRIIFAGARSDIPNLLAAMDVFLFPSLFEGLGLAVVEAQAAGLPVVVSDSIPAEALVIPEACTALSLNDPVEQWVNTLRTVAMTTDVDATARIAASPFHQEQNFARLAAIYARSA